MPENSNAHGYPSNPEPRRGSRQLLVALLKLMAVLAFAALLVYFNPGTFAFFLGGILCALVVPGLFKMVKEASAFDRWSIVAAIAGVLVLAAAIAVYVALEHRYPSLG